LSYTYLKEITDWGEQKVKNHTYIFNEKNQNVGYIISGTKEELFYNKPSKLFSKARRKFVEVKQWA
tara:strand:+ start:980 stop:1177 length:198 start_codon:yes stop_codon:yes gene_type:complete